MSALIIQRILCGHKLQ